MASRAEFGSQVATHKDHSKKMSTHIAYALVVYTLLLIFEVSPMIKGSGMSIWPYFLLVALVGLVIMPCRNLERKWQLIDAQNDGEVEAMFRRDLVGLWVAAIGLPNLLMAIIWIIP
jgi:hypothetical protein